MSDGLTLAEKVRRRQRTRALAREMAEALRQRVPDLPLEIDQIVDAPVTDEDASLIVKTDGVAVLRVLAAANDLARELATGPEGIRIIPRVWPRTIWCRRSSRPAPKAPEPGQTGEVGSRVSSARDARGNILLCIAGSHSGDHDFDR